MKRVIRILIADPHTMFRDALRCVLEMEPGMSVVGEASNGRETAEQVRRLHPDILLLDLAAPQLSGIDVLRTLSCDKDPVRTLIMVDGAANASVVLALKYGARGIVPKRTTSPLLFKSIRAVADGEYWVGHENILHLVDHLRDAAPAQEAQAARREGYHLTARELEVVTSIVDGATNKDIAQKLSISEQTVKHHLTSVFGKVGVSNRLELALFAMHEGKDAFGKPPGVLP